MPEPTHSRFPPSKAAVWSVCTASIPFLEANAGLIREDSSVYADEGTECHAQVAAILQGQQRLLGTDKPDADMVVHGRAYIEFVRDKVRPGDRLLVEHRVPLFYLPEQKGTIDAAIVSPDRLYIADLKYGAGVSVYAKENEQLASYAESLIRQLEVIEEMPDGMLVTLAIYQPRDRNDPNPVRLWAITRAELREFTQPIGEAQKRILKGKVDAEGNILAGDICFKAGPHCDKGFCAARGICKAYAARDLTAISDEPVDTIIQSKLVTLTDPGRLSRAQRQKVLAAKPGIVKWLEVVEDQEIHELTTGAAPLEFKLVEGKSNRAWSDEAAAEQLLRNHLAADVVRPPGKIISPKGAEDALKGVELSTKFQNRFAALVTKPEGKPSLVPVTDKRPALEFNPTAGLAALPDASDVI